MTFSTHSEADPWTWLDRYHCLLSLASIALFFTDLDFYVYWAKVSPLPPITWIYVFAVLALPLMILSPSRGISKPLLLWIGSYLMITVASYVFLSTGNEFEVQELRTRMLSVAFIAVMMVIFSNQSRVHAWVRKLIVIATVIAAINNVLGASVPDLFGDSGVVGRWGGWYVNPTKSGMGLMLGLVFGTEVLVPLLRIPYVMLGGVGILLTFSRGAMLMWILLLVWLLVRGKIPHQQTAGWFLGLILLGLITGLQGEEIVRGFNLPPQIIERLEWFQNPLENKGDAEGSSGARMEVAETAWEMFLQRPLTGYGVGSTVTWSFPISTHNMYLSLMADYGLIGVAMLPTLVWSVVWKARGVAKSLSPSLGGSMLIWGIFSHNILDEFYILMSFSLMGAMTIASQKDRASSIRDNTTHFLDPTYLTQIQETTHD
jgi:O-Antigen ligase